ncbi:MAG: alpha/beta hydrolase [Terriglobia bacterium]
MRTSNWQRLVISLCLFPALSFPLHAEFLEVSAQVKLFYESAGAGNPLVFIPGWTMSSGIWNEQRAVFSKTHRVITFDPRSQGNSSKAVSGNSLQQHAKDLRKLIEDLNLHQVTLIGWAMAVGTILEYVNLYDDDRVKALVLVDGSPCLLKREDWAFGMSPDDAYRTLMGYENQRVAQTSQFVESLFKTDRSDTELDWIVNDAMRTPTSVATVLAFDYFYADRRPLLSKITLPTLLVMTLENKGVGDYMKGAIQTSTLNTFDGVGSAIFLEDPQKFNDCLATFLRSLP